MIRKLSLVQVDVFTDRALTGNSLAVILDGRGLTTEQMQAIALEMNLSETTFILPGDPAAEKTRGTRVRIFTVQEELPFAGHPTLGTAFVLARRLCRRRSPARSQRWHGAGALFATRCLGPRLRRDDPNAARVRRDPRPRVSCRGHKPERRDLAGAAPIQTVSTGVAFTIVPVRRSKSAGPSRRCPPRPRISRPLSWKIFLLRLPRDRQSQSPPARPHDLLQRRRSCHRFRRWVRAAWMVAHGIAASDEQVFIEQGIEMHRPSSIFVRAANRDNQVVNVRVGGNCVEVLRAEITLTI